MLTNREKKLMLAAFKTGFIYGMQDVGDGHSSTQKKEIFESWLSEVITDKGSTVEQCLSRSTSLTSESD